MEGKHSTLRAERKKAWAIIRFMFVALVLTNTASAQQKVGTMPEWVTSYLEAYYTLNFVGATAAARGGAGVALNQGAMSLAANPAAIFPRGRVDFALEAAGLRNNLEYRILPEFDLTDARDYSQPAFRPAAAAVSIRLNNRAAFGVCITNPRSYKMHYNLIFTETTYEYPYGIQDYELSLFQQLNQWQTTAAVALKLLPGLSVGVALDVLSSHITYESKLDDVPFPMHTSLNETYHSYLIRGGLRQQIADFAYGITARTGDRFGVTYDDLEDDQVVEAEIPWELTIGLVYRNAIGFEVRRVGFRNHWYDPDNDTENLIDYGVGSHIQMWSDQESRSVFVNLGVIYRTLVESGLQSDDQTFLNLGAELHLERIRLAATVINGHWLSDKEVRVSELQLSMGYAVP